MQLGRVIGTVVASQKVSGMKGQKILMLQPLTDDLTPVGQPLAAIDSVQAGPDALVHWVTAREAALVLTDSFVPVDAAITGIVDDVQQVDGGIKDQEEIFE